MVLFLKGNPLDNISLCTFCQDMRPLKAGRCQHYSSGNGYIYENFYTSVSKDVLMYTNTILRPIQTIYHNLNYLIECKHKSDVAPLSPRKTNQR